MATKIKDPENKTFVRCVEDGVIGTVAGVKRHQINAHGGESPTEPATFDEWTASRKSTRKPKAVTRDELAAMKVGELRALAETRGVEGFRKMKHDQLVDALAPAVQIDAPQGELVDA